MSKEPRTGQLLPFSAAIAYDGDDPVFRAYPDGATLTDEQWAQRDAEIAAIRAREREAVERERSGRKRKALGDAGFPRRAIENAAIADESNPVIARIRAWDPKRESVLVLSGPKGIGKTVAAAWWASRQDWAPMFVRATTFAASSRYDREVKERWLNASALVLDDLGTEYVDAKGSFLVDLDELLDLFYGDRKPLVITTNCTHEAFAERYGERVMDRLRECASWFSSGGPSLRGKP